MPAERIADLTTPALQQSALARSSVLADYWALTKPDVNLLILITTFAGFCLARPIQSVDFPILLLFHTLLGTLLLASGTGTLNQFVERRFAAPMRPTKRPPIAAARIETSPALRVGIPLPASGAIYPSADLRFLSVPTPALT